MWENSNLMQNLYNNKPMRTMMHTHTHKCCDIGPVLPWGYTPWNKRVIKLVNLMVCEKILGNSSSHGCLLKYSLSF